MLAQNFKTPAQLKISSKRFAALVSVLGMFDREEIPAEMFDMGDVGDANCNTPRCILGWARTIDPDFGDTVYETPLGRLFYTVDFSNSSITRAQAAAALRNFLTTGAARWREVMQTER